MSSSGRSKTARASWVVNTARLAPSGRAPLSGRSTPAMRYSATFPLPATPIRSPTPTPAARADVRSITTSWSLVGGPPSTKRHGDTAGSLGQFAPRGCSESPGDTTGVPSGRMITAMSSMRGDTERTPGILRRDGVMVSGTRRRTCSIGDW